MLSSRPSPWFTRALHFCIAAIAITGLVLQFQVSHGTLSARGDGLATTLLKLASYFTILTNLLLAIAHGICLLAPRTKAGRFFAHPAVQSGLLLYILVVKIVYVSFLAGLWNPEGKQWWADNLLHHLTPLFQIVFWVAFVPKGRLSWRLALLWLAWPACYLVWALARGHDYPYPFLELDRLGPARTALNCLLMGAGFLAGGLGVIGLDRLLAPKPAR